jgi:hypothetical protein
MHMLILKLKLDFRKIELFINVYNKQVSEAEYSRSIV